MSISREEFFEKYSSLLGSLDDRYDVELREDMTFWRAGEDCKVFMDLVLRCNDLLGGCEISRYHINPSSLAVSRSTFVLKCGLDLDVYTNLSGVELIYLTGYIDPDADNNELFGVMNYLKSNCPFKYKSSVRGLGAWGTFF